MFPSLRVWLCLAAISPLNIVKQYICMHIYTLMLPKKLTTHHTVISNYMFSAEAAIGSCTSRYVLFFAKSRSFGVLSHSKGFLQTGFPKVAKSLIPEVFPRAQSQVNLFKYRFSKSSFCMGCAQNKSIWEQPLVLLKSTGCSVYNACTYSCLLTTTQPYLRCYCLILAPTCCYLLLFATTFRSATATFSSTNTTCCYVPTTRKPPRLRPFQVTPTTLKSRTRGKEKRDLRRVDKARKRLLLGFSAFNTYTLVVKQKPFACMQLTLFLLCSRKQAKASESKPCAQKTLLEPYRRQERYSIPRNAQSWSLWRREICKKPFWLRTRNCALRGSSATRCAKHHATSFLRTQIFWADIGQFRSQPVRCEIKNLAQSPFPNQNLQNTPGADHFESCDLEKMHAVVTRSTFRSRMTTQRQPTTPRKAKLQ